MDKIISLLNEKGNDPLLSVPFKKAQEVYTNFTFFKPLTPELKNAELSTTNFLLKLLEEKNFLDAIQFLAHGLPTKEAISWAYQSVGSMQKESSLELHLVQDWLEDSTEEKCGACGENAENFKDPITWLRLAVFWCGTNISTHKDVKVVPDPKLSGHAASTAIILAAAAGDPKEINEKHTAFLEDGIKRALGITSEIKENV